MEQMEERRNTTKQTIKQRFLSNLWALVDQSAWTMMLPVVLALYLIDPTVTKTMLQWTLMLAAVAGFVIILARVMFPSIHISDLMDYVKRGNIASALVMIGMLYFMAQLLNTAAQWAKP